MLLAERSSSELALSTLLAWPLFGNMFLLVEVAHRKTHDAAHHMAADRRCTLSRVGNWQAVVSLGSSLFTAAEIERSQWPMWDIAPKEKAGRTQVASRDKARIV